MSIEVRDVSFHSSVSWWLIGLRFGLGFYTATVLFAALMFGGWIFLGSASFKTGLNQTTQGVEHALNSIPKPALPKPPKVHTPRIDPKSQEMCLKLSSGVLNEQYIECMQESATDASQ